VGGIHCGPQRMLASIVQLIIWAAASMVKDTDIQKFVWIEGTNRILFSSGCKLESAAATDATSLACIKDSFI
jgi:hypothetical protein